MSVVEVEQGKSPVILCFPHAGTDVPGDIWEGLNENGRVLADTDWHIDRLYAGVLPEATTVRAMFHRYVIDANRDPAGGSLYPGQNTTDLVPTTDFDGKPIWREGCLPGESDVAKRVEGFHARYHAALLGEIERVKALHGVVVVYDCHSIRSWIPFLFEGRLPDFNVGTHGGVSCDLRIEEAVVGVTSAAEGFSSVLNGRFKGGWTTRHYGRPSKGVHAIQMELGQRRYLVSETQPFEYDAEKALVLRKYLRAGLGRVEKMTYQMS